jgi:hypothetical protein
MVELSSFLELLESSSYLLEFDNYYMVELVEEFGQLVESTLFSATEEISILLHIYHLFISLSCTLQQVKNSVTRKPLSVLFVVGMVLYTLISALLQQYSCVAHLERKIWQFFEGYGIRNNIHMPCRGLNTYINKKTKYKDNEPSVAMTTNSHHHHHTASSTPIVAAQHLRHRIAFIEGLLNVFSSSLLLLEDAAVGTADDKNELLVATSIISNNNEATTSVISNNNSEHPPSNNNNCEHPPSNNNNNLTRLRLCLNGKSLKIIYHAYFEIMKTESYVQIRPLIRTEDTSVMMMVEEGEVGKGGGGGGGGQGTGGGIKQCPRRGVGGIGGVIKMSTAMERDEFNESLRVLWTCILREQLWTARNIIGEAVDYVAFYLDSVAPISASSAAEATSGTIYYDEYDDDVVVGGVHTATTQRSRDLRMMEAIGSTSSTSSSIIDLEGNPQSFARIFRFLEVVCNPFILIS